VNLIGLLSWFDEPKDALLACLAGLAESGVHHVVALDGRYVLYPADHDVSGPDEYAAILLGCRELGMACTIQQPRGPWVGGEVAKRTALFVLALSVADGGDWFWVQDADQVTVKAPDDLKQRLADSPHDIAEVQILDTVALRANQPNWPASFAMRALFRAQPIAVGPSHCMYRAADGSLLWGYEGDGRMCPALDLTEDVLVEHRPDRRPHERQHAKLVYYAQRDAALIERGTCELCDQQATSIQPARWRWSDIGPVAEWMECCAEHAETVRAVNEIELRKMGVDPASVVAENRNGRVPVKV
jgi:hypothetical protein